jgi:hypothetical protein
VRNIYTDEAGTSPAPHEPYRVVIGLIVHADTQWFPALQRFGELLQGVPHQYRKNFSFHAKDLFARNKYPNWDYEERKELMRDVMRIPFEFDIPIAVSAVKKGAHDWTAWPEKKMSTTMVDHLIAFTFCMFAADYYLRTRCKDEVAQVIAEHNESMHRYLQQGLDLARMRALQAECTIDNGETRQTIGELKVERIIDEIHFTHKFRAPFLQIADACAFALRRAFSEQNEGKEFARATLGEHYEIPHRPAGQFFAICTRPDHGARAASSPDSGGSP